MFDADQYCAAHHEPPAFQWKGRRFVGRILSAEEWVRLHSQQADVLRANERRAAVEADRDLAATKNVRGETVDRVVRRAFRVANRFTRSCITSWFPAPWYLRPIAWLLPGLFHPAWRAFQQMPGAVQVEAVMDFSESQRRATPTVSQPPGTKQETTPADPPSGT